MPDIGIATIEVCLKALEELPHEDALAAVQYITMRLNIKEQRRRVIEAQKQKLGRELTEAEANSAMDEWDESAERDAPAVAGAPTVAAMTPPLGTLKRAI